MRTAFWCILAALVSAYSSAQEVQSARVKGFRIYGEKEGELPIARLAGHPITIEFDVDATAPQNFRMKFYHCDKNWEITKNSFINDDLKNTIKFPLPFEPAPKFVHHYTFHYKVKIPGFEGLDRFPQSGNYIFQLWDGELKELVCTGKFFVVEETIAPSMKVTNRYLPSAVSPWNQVNRIDVALIIPQHTDSGNEFYPILLKTVDIYKNRQLGSPYRVSTDDDNPNTFVDGFGLSNVKFIIDNVHPGNEYRRLDLRNIDLYPPDKEARSREGADVSRFLHQGPKDNNGASILTSGDRYADYLQFQFELLRDSDDLDSVYVVGDFNAWRPSEEWRMSFDLGTKRYRLVASLRRGVYDYQYVVGKNDWITVEGNDWRTVNLYTAFVYYDDPHFGGFDRILGYVQGLGPGGVEATSN